MSFNNENTRPEIIKTITIREPFYGAGTTYGWTKDGFDIHGIGVKANKVNTATKLIIKIGDQTYKVETNKIKQFVKHYKSIYVVQPQGVRLGVFSKSLLTNITSKAGKIMKEWEQRGWLKKSDVDKANKVIPNQKDTLF